MANIPFPDIFLRNIQLGLESPGQNVLTSLSGHTQALSRGTVRWVLTIGFREYHADQDANLIQQISIWLGSLDGAVNTTDIPLQFVNQLDRFPEGAVFRGMFGDNDANPRQGNFVTRGPTSVGFGRAPQGADSNVPPSFEPSFADRVSDAGNPDIVTTNLKWGLRPGDYFTYKNSLYRITRGFLQPGIEAVSTYENAVAQTGNGFGDRATFQPYRPSLEGQENEEWNFTYPTIRARRANSNAILETCDADGFVTFPNIQFVEAVNG